MPGYSTWRIVGVDVVGDGADLELSALHLYGQAAKVDGVTITSSHAPVAGALASLDDANTATMARFAAADVRSSGFYIQWQCAVAVDVTGVGLGAGSVVGRYLYSLTLQYLRDGLWESVPQLGAFVWPGANALGPVAWFDIYYNQVALLLRGDGTSIVDRSPTPMSLTPVGVTQSTGQTNYWPRSISFGSSGTNNYLAVGSASRLALEAKDFTIESWFYYLNGTPTTSQQMLYFNYAAAFTTNSLYIGRHGALGSKFSFWAYNYSSSTPMLVDPSLPPDNAWVHYAIARRGDQFLLLRNFQVVATATFAGAVTGASQDVGYIGDSVQSLRGFMDDIRFTIGVCRYPASAPPVAHGLPPLAMAALPVRTRGNRARLLATAPWIAPAMLRSRASIACDIEFGGPGRIWGINEIEITPGTRVPTGGRVVLLRQRDKLPVRQTWADPATGAWEIRGIDTSQDYVALAEDLVGNYRPAAANKLTPEAT